MEPGSVSERFRPAVGSEMLVPPVKLVRGDCLSGIMVLIRIPKAAICSPGPLVPSHVEFIYHLRPQLLGKAVPLHCFIAATADFLSRGLMMDEVWGAICTVNASHRDR